MSNGSLFHNLSTATASAEMVEHPIATGLLLLSIYDPLSTPLTITTTCRTDPNKKKHHLDLKLSINTRCSYILERNRKVHQSAIRL